MILFVCCRRRAQDDVLLRVVNWASYRGEGQEEWAPGLNLLKLQVGGSQKQTDAVPPVPASQTQIPCQSAGSRSQVCAQRCRMLTAPQRSTARWPASEAALSTSADVVPKATRLGEGRSADAYLLTANKKLMNFSGSPLNAYEGTVHTERSCCQGRGAWRQAYTAANAQKTRQLPAAWGRLGPCVVVGQLGSAPPAVLLMRLLPPNLPGRCSINLH